MAPLKGPGAPQSHDGTPLRIAILHARWNTPIITALVSGARSALLAHGVRPHNIVIESVPGSYELPFAAQRLYAASQIQASTSSVAAKFGGLLSGAADAGGDLLGSVVGGESGEGESGGEGQGGNEEEGPSTAALDAVIAIGVLIKGETMHFEYIAEAVSQGLMRVQLDAGVPVVFGLLTVLTEQQAMVRAGMEAQAGKGHNHGEDWAAAAVELGVKRRRWGEGKID
ncbi:hypothetical protein MMC13_006698 [Lambiella insularis]|nr:hypothetical protein [Lambiella insularis]